MIPEAAVEAAAAGMAAQAWDDWEMVPDAARRLFRRDARIALESAAPHMLEQATEDRELVEERVKAVVQEVAMTVDYTERLYAAVQEIMAITMPKPTP